MLIKVKFGWELYDEEERKNNWNYIDSVCKALQQM